MLTFDESGNHIATTLYETYLAKEVIENPQFYKNVYIKINIAIKNLIDLNKHDRQFDRRLFAVFSSISELFPGYTCMENILNKEFDILVQTEFHKQFFECLFNRAQKKLTLQTPNQIKSSLCEIAQYLVATHPENVELLKKQLRPKELFSEKGRSRSENDQSKQQNSHKFGITHSKHTPESLKHYFKTSFIPAQEQFTRNPQGLFSQWLKARELPFISGPSGSIEILYSHIIQLDLFSLNEIKSYFMASAAARVARGHHSFAEAMIIMAKLGFPCRDLPDRQNFYEQILTNEFLNSTNYQNFMKQPHIQDYFEQYKLESKLENEYTNM